MSSGNFEMSKYVIRPAKKEDCQAIRQLIQELADYEKMPDGPKIDAAVLEKDGFGDRKFFEACVAVSKESMETVGYALYFFVYSTWQGKSLYLEDIYVQPDHRKQGLGLGMFRFAAQVAIKEDCQRLNFSVLNWNEPSINFYKSLGAVDLTKDEGWHSFRLYRHQVEILAQMSPKN